jgi:limonene-1,2-epoxide hydrolase
MSNSDTVRAFIAAWEARALDDILALMTPDARWLNVGLPESVGIDAIRAAIAPFVQQASSVRWTVHHIAETPSGAVLTERTDVFEMGGKTLTAPVMGVFEFRDGKIAAWRDYFDLPGFQKQMG